MKISVLSLACFAIAGVRCKADQYVDPDKKAGKKQEHAVPATPTSGKKGFRTPAPTTAGSRRLLLCSVDSCRGPTQEPIPLLQECNAYQDQDKVYSQESVHDVNSALKIINDSAEEALDAADGNSTTRFNSLADTLIRQGPVLSLSSLALSKLLSPHQGGYEKASKSSKSSLQSKPPLDFDFVTQTLIWPQSLETAAHVDALVEMARESFSAISSNLNDPSAVDLMNHFTALNKAYQDFIQASAGDGIMRATKERYMHAFQGVCNSESFRPQNLFRAVYGYGCGDAGTGRNCSDPSTGTCTFGIKTNQLLENSINDPLNQVGQGNLEYFQSVGTWIGSTLAALIFYHSACLPPVMDSCVASISDPIDEMTLQAFGDAFQEVALNLEQSQNCILSNPPEESNGRILVCRIDSRGYPVPEDVPAYDRAEPVFTSTTVESVQGVALGTRDALFALNENVKFLRQGVGAFTEANGFTKKEAAFYKNAGRGLAAAGAGINIYMIATEKNEPSAAQVLIRDSFAEINNQLAELASLLQFFFDLVRVDIRDAEFDNFQNILQSIRRAYFNYVEAQTLEENATLPIYKKREYVEQFRAACNVPHFQPLDIFRNLYGQACGDNTEARQCSARNGVDTGTCFFGNKARLYSIDVYKEFAAFDISNFLAFGLFLSNAMLEAMYLHEACLPLTLNSCEDKSTDPDYLSSLDEMARAMDEVVDNLAKVSQCFSDAANWEDGLTLASLGNPEKCLQQEFFKDGKEFLTDKAVCMREIIKRALRSGIQFQKYDFAVLVYTFEDRELGPDGQDDDNRRVYFASNSANMTQAGAFRKTFPELENFYIVLRWRLEGIGLKELSAGALDAVDDVGVDDPLPILEQFEKDEGYLLIRDNLGTPFAASTDEAAFRFFEDEDDYFFWF